MDSKEFIEALRDTGLVSNNPDGKGLKIYVTVNDFDEEMGEKRNREKWSTIFIRLQSIALVVTMICLIFTTIYSVSKPKKYEYFSRNQYILKYNNDTGELCVIPETPTVEFTQKSLGKIICD